MLDEILESRDAMLKKQQEPVVPKIVDQLTKKQLAQIICSHTFADVKGESFDGDNLLHVSLSTVNFVIHGEDNWTSTQPSSVIALSVSAHHNATLEMLNQFNATVKVGKAYKVPSIGVLFRHEIVLAGGITEDNLMMQIRMFTELYYDFLMAIETPTEKSEQH